MNFIKKIALFTIIIMFCHTLFAKSTDEKPVYTKTLLIFDLHSNQKPTYSKFLQGKNVALLTHNSAKDLDKNIIESDKFLFTVFNEYMLTNKNTLKKMDKDHDGIINAQEPLFDKLAVLRFVQNKDGRMEQTVEPLYKYGVRKIILNGKYISLAPENRKKHEQYVAGVAILNDGTAREILDVVTGQQ